MRPLVLSLLVILFTACGKTGNLYLPDEKTTVPEDKATVPVEKAAGENKPEQLSAEPAD